MSFYDSLKSVRLWGALAGIFLSYLTYASHDLIGRDAILYVQTAQAYLDSGFKAAQAVYAWPFYSIAFAYIHKISGFSLEISAQIFDAMLTVLLVDSFYRLYRETVVDSTISWVPMVTILAFSGINDYRQEIVRDWGFWAFSLLAFVYLLKIYKAPSLKNALLWQCFIAIAFLFRIEAIGFIATSSLIVLSGSAEWRKKIVNYIHANIIFIVVFLTGIVLFFLSGSKLHELGRIDRIVAFLSLSHPTGVISAHQEKIAEHVMSYHGGDLAGPFLFAGVFGVVLYKIVVKIGFFYNAILALGVVKFSDSRSKTYFPFIGILIFTAFLLVYVYVLHDMIIAGRYIILTTILSLVFVAYYFERIIEFCLKARHTVTLNVLKMGYAISLAAGVFHMSASKDYLKQLGEWSLKYMDANAKVISNEARLYYYSGRQVPYDRFSSGVIQSQHLDSSLLAENDFVLLRLKDDNHDFDQFIHRNGTEKIKEFCNRKGDCAALFRLVHY